MWAESFHHGRVAALDLFTDRAPLFVFAGDVGSGKSALAESFGCDLADQLNLPVFLYRLKLATCGSGLVGEMTSLIGDAFSHLHHQGRQATGPRGINSALVFVVDEADALVQSREAAQMHHEDRAGVDAFLAGIDSLVGTQIPVIVVLCTNRVGALDPAVMRRAAATFTFTRPDEQSATPSSPPPPTAPASTPRPSTSWSPSPAPAPTGPATPTPTSPSDSSPPPSSTPSPTAPSPTRTSSTSQS